MARRTNRKKKDEAEYHKMITSYNEMRRENKTLREENGVFRKENEDLKEENVTLKRHLAHYDNSNTPPSQKVLKHSQKTRVTVHVI